MRTTRRAHAAIVEQLRDVRGFSLGSEFHRQNHWRFVRCRRRCRLSAGRSSAFSAARAGVSAAKALNEYSTFVNRIEDS